MSQVIDYSQTPLTYRDVEAYTQGVEIRNLSRRRAVSTLPVIYGGQGELTIVQLNFGQGASESEYTPFRDRRGTLLPTEILDLGRKTFDEIQSYHTEDLTTFNGVIEPLSIRDALTSTHAELKSLRSIKGDIGLYSINGMGSIMQEETYEFAPNQAPGSAFYDSQDTFGTRGVPGYSGIESSQPSPFDDQHTQEVKSVYYTGRYPREAPEFGITRKAAGRGFTYDNCKYGTDSLAFGGLTR